MPVSSVAGSGTKPMCSATAPVLRARGLRAAWTSQWPSVTFPRVLCRSWTARPPTTSHHTQPTFPHRNGTTQPSRLFSPRLHDALGSKSRRSSDTSAESPALPPLLAGGISLYNGARPLPTPRKTHHPLYLRLTGR